jgi:YidC/Oxa1 family membrane protein insertase
MSTTGARATAWQLKAYKIDSGAPVDLVASLGLRATPGGLAAWADPEQIEGVFEVDKDRLDLTQTGTTGTLTFKHISANGIQLEKRLSFHADRYDVEINLAVRNVSRDSATTQTRFAWGPGLRNSTDKKVSTIQPPTLWVDGKRMQVDLATVSGERLVEGKLSWAALQDTYFTAALLPMDKDLNAFVSKAPEEQPIVGLIGPKQTLPASGEVSARVLVYAGPRDLDLLRGVGHDLDQLIDLGWFDFLARPALWLLKFLYHYTGNYGVAIILITILQKIAFHPLTHKSMKSMQAMQAIQPKVQALQERYKNNPQKKQEETMALYRKHGVNPMGGCLPMLAQIPIFIALYNALSSSVEMWQARFLWISDLTQPDSLFSAEVWGGYVLSANVLALLMGVSMWFQQKMSPTTGDPRQAQMMLWMMPIIFTFMFWSFPSGLVLYWLVNNVLQIGQQWLINRGAARPSPAEGQPA